MPCYSVFSAHRRYHRTALLRRDRGVLIAVWLNRKHELSGFKLDRLRSVSPFDELDTDEIRLPPHQATSLDSSKTVV
jgi:hypothetical protein